MTEAQTEALQLYGHHLRVRVCGILRRGTKFLVVKHRAILENGYFYAPPGGGLQFGETIHEALVREFREETNLVVGVGKFLTINEFVRLPLHAIELFYEVHSPETEAHLGTDPEMHHQLIEGLEWLCLEELHAIENAEIHKIFEYLESVETDSYRNDEANINSG